MFKMKMTRKIQTELTFGKQNEPCSLGDENRPPNRKSNITRSQKIKATSRLSKMAILLALCFTVGQAQEQEGDCIVFDIENPYRDDAPQTYQSFDTLTPFEEPCEVKFTADSLGTSILGSSTGTPFQNPYSARRINRVTTSLYKGCEKNGPPAVESDVEMSFFQQRMIPDNKASFTSSSTQIGVINAQLSVKFTTTSGMPANGIVTVETPAWFAINKESAVKTFSSESMLDFASEASFQSHSKEGFEVIQQTFDASSRNIVIQYSGTRQIRANEEVEFRITDFKNPVNKSYKEGFQVSTSDSLGYLIDKSSNSLPLETRMVQPGDFSSKDLMMLGDSEGINVGRVGVYNKVQLFLSSTIPLEEGCQFKFVFPKELPIDERLSTIEGEGIFQPAVDRYKLGNSEFKVDVEKNTVYVSGCQIPDLLSSRPFGLIYFGYIKLPDYVTDTGSFQIFAYSDPFLQDLTFSDTGQGESEPLIMTTEMMKPGIIKLNKFTPSNYYAYMTNVEFTISFIPTSQSYPSTRIIIEMPKTLFFDAEKGCSVDLAFAKCAVDVNTNIITLTEIFRENFPGGTEIKFILKSATNPTGAREAGSWSIRTERPFDGKFFTVDRFDSETSFYALPGYIKSNLVSEDSQTFVTNTKFDFKFVTEHNIPSGGFLYVRLPDEMQFPAEVVESQNLKFSADARVQLEGGETAPKTTPILSLVTVNEQEARFQLPEGHDISTNPIHLILEGARTPRSFRPSSQFTITSYTPDGKYIIDQGGQDIFVTMNKMSKLRGIQIEPQDLTNGDFVTYKVTIDSHLTVKNGDILHMTVPDECGISTDVFCEPFIDPENENLGGISAVSCSQLNQNLIIIIEKVDKKDGQFSLLVNGIKNPPSFRRSGYFSKIFMTTGDYFKMQQVADYMGLYVQTNQFGTITDYLRRQSTELYAGVGSYEINFQPYNRISANGVMTLEWSDQVVVFEETACNVETYTTFEEQLCDIDFAAKKIVIKNAFYKDQPYKNNVKITLSKVQNPETNRSLQPFVIKTYEDEGFIYGIDQLIYDPLLQCVEPCFTCGAEKDYCLSCWADSEENFFMQTESFSTCRSKCDDGYTTDGDQRLWCSRCDEACATCADEGVQGDRYICETCSPDYSFYDPFNLKCLQECPVGTYDTAGNLCQQCSDKCRSCSDKSTCTSCKQNSDIPFLLGNECLATCPKGFGSIAGVCLECELPCSECSTGPQICTACDQSKGPSYLYGPNCIAECPQGFITNEEEKRCEGCAPGCFECDPNDQRICLKCDPQLMLLGQKCVSDCPPGYLSNYQADICYSISGLDVTMVYFPFLILTLLFMLLSLVGTKQKRKHLLIPNFIVLMGILEHAGLITQIILTYFYGTWRYMACVGAFWLFYVIGNIIFQVQFTKHVIGKDKLYIQWRERPANRWGRKMMQALGMIFSWKAYKLCYSGFWGYKLNPVKFSEPNTFRNIQRRVLFWNIFTTYLGMFVLCFVGLVDLDFNTQLYIMMIENLAIAVIMTWAGLYEQSMLNKYLNQQGKYKSLSGGGAKGKFDVMSVLQEEPGMPDFNKTREALLNVKDIKTKNMFIERKQEELQEMFGPFRSCRSEVVERHLDEDPRRCHTWPAFNINEEDYPIDIKDPYPDLVYARGLTEEQMRQMKYLSKNAPHKATQAGAYEADFNLRKDALLVGHQRELLEEVKSTKKGKARGRKNRYVKQIDHEDNDAGILLDDDAEGKARNEKAKNELLDKEASLEVARQKEERGLRKQEGKLRNQEAKERAMQLTEENLKLKRQLEEQRMKDAKESREFQRRIVEEEKRREAILAEIELKRRERELNRSKLEQEVNNAENMLKQVRATTPTAANKNLNADLPRQPKEAEQNLKKSDLKSEKAPPTPTKTASPPQVKEKTPQKGVKLQLEKAQESERAKQSSRKSNRTPVSGKKSNSQVNDGQKSDTKNTDLTAQPPIVPNLQLAEQFESAQGDIYNRLVDFNEIDIAGDLDRDNKGNLIVPVSQKTGKKLSKDRSSLPINKFGYRIDPTSGDILFAKSGKVAFAKSELDEAGNIPHPYFIEKFNFNPYELLGTFFYDDYEDPLSFQRGMRQGMTIDELGRQVSIQGFLCDSNGSLFDRHGNMRFDWRQFAPYGNLMPKLYNYSGRTFEIQEVMGIFDRDEQGNIQLLVGKDEQGSDVFVDKAGFTVNKRGYIVTREGNICTRQGKVLFMQHQLKDGEFPKIFPFSRFNISKVLGDFNTDTAGCPILVSTGTGFVDKQGRPVNQKGYLIDKFENVVDQRGNVVFTRRLLDQTGDIPEIFRLNLLRSDSASSLSRLMSDLDREQRQQDSLPTGHLRKNDSNLPRHGAASDTSFESLMGDSPSKYDQQNQRFSLTSAPTADGNNQKGMKWNERENEGIKEESDSDGEGRKGGQSRRKKKRKTQGFVVEDPTGRDIQLASAYGGVAKPRIRKTGQRFVVAANRLDRAGLMTSHVPSRPGNPRMQNLTGHRNSNFDTTGNQSGEEVNKPSSSNLKKRLGSSVRRNDRDVEQTTNRTLNATAVTTTVHGRSKIASRTGARGGGTLSSNLNNDQQTGSIESAIMEQDQQATVIKEMRTKKLEARRKKNHTMQNEQKSRQKGAKPQPNLPKYDRAFEEEFEKLYKKDIDKFIDGSDFEVESLAGFSELSKGTFTSAVQNPRMKGLEKVYLQRLEFQNLGTKTQKSASRSRPKPIVKREFMDRFEDNPKFISKGENLKFEVGAAHSGTGNSSEKKQHPYNPKGSRSVLRDTEGVGMIQTSDHQGSSAQFRQQPYTPENYRAPSGAAMSAQQPQANSTRDPYRQMDIRPFDPQKQRPSRQNLG